MYDHVTSTVMMEDDFEAYKFHVRVCKVYGLCKCGYFVICFVREIATKG